MLLGRGRVLKRPLGAIEAIKGAHEAFGGIGGRGTPGRADGWQQLGQFGQEPGHDGLSRAAVRFALERVQAALHGALRGGPKERLEFVGPSPSGVATGHLLAPSSQGGAEGLKATQQMLGVGKDAGNGLYIGIPAVGDDDCGVIPSRFELQQEERAVRRGVGGQEGYV